MDLNNPIPQEWTRYVTQSPIGLEVIPAVLYSTKTYASAATTILTFFDFVQGSRQDLTNMKQPNMLPNPEAFLAQNIRFYVKDRVQSDDSGAPPPSVNVASEFDDVVQLVNNGILNFTIGNKSYGPWPLWMLPANSFVKGAFASGTDALLDHGQVDGNLYPLEPNLLIAPLQQFSVTLTWPAGALTLSNANTDLQILFDGKMARAVQ